MLNAADRFASTVGQFVLTASLRSQVNSANRALFKDVSPERCLFTENVHDGVLTHTLQGIRRFCSWLCRAALFRVQLPRLIISLSSHTPRTAYESRTEKGKGASESYVNICERCKDHRP